ncbi:hypothetical protein KP509_16G019300 [Ceratopteris richardii]|uniref:Uncharacterized protein n=1 Tax=Ceratopteris richardii TaxID=49495 RepID=A0A8T2SX07_CERRI|nr:hypothetical protein KP509_16G019300 [Ceratopteris richardii]
MAMKVGMLRTEPVKPVDDHTSLQWGHYKRRRLTKSGVFQSAQRSDLVSVPASHVSQRISNMNTKPSVSEVAYTKGNMEKSCTDHQSEVSDKPSNANGPIMPERDLSRIRSSPYRNGQTRRRTELDSLHDKHLVMQELNLAVSRWPKLLISLSHKEKEDDFMVMKGTRLPQRPKRRAKHVEKLVTYISPGSWLCEVSLDRYEVREKKSLRKKPAGLKAMESIDSDSD